MGISVVVRSREKCEARGNEQFVRVQNVEAKKPADLNVNLSLPPARRLVCFEGSVVIVCVCDQERHKNVREAKNKIIQDSKHSSTFSFSGVCIPWGATTFFVSLFRIVMRPHSLRKEGNSNPQGVMAPPGSGNHQQAHGGSARTRRKTTNDRAQR